MGAAGATSPAIPPSTPSPRPPGGSVHPAATCCSARPRPGIRPPGVGHDSQPVAERGDRRCITPAAIAAPTRSWSRTVRPAAGTHALSAPASTTDASTGRVSSSVGAATSTDGSSVFEHRAFGVAFSSVSFVGSGVAAMVRFGSCAPASTSRRRGGRRWCRSRGGRCVHNVARRSRRRHGRRGCRQG